MELTGKAICIVVENLPVPFDRRVWQESTALKRAGAEVAVICPTGKYADAYFEQIDGVRIYRYDLPLEGNGLLGYCLEYFSAYRNQARLLKRVWRDFDGLDAIQFCNPPDLLYLNALPYKKRYGTKLVFDHHDISPELYLAKFGRKDFIYRMLLHFEARSFSACDRSIATNESYRAIATGRGGMDPDKVTVIRSGPALERFSAVEPREDLKKNNSIIIGYVGVIGQQEGVDHLLDAMKHLVQTFGYDQFHCYVCGNGPSLAGIKRYCTTLGIDEFVTFTGRIADSELMAILSTADICVNPDVHNEMNDKSTMNKIMEYMALGKPVVQYDLTEGRRSAGGSSLYVKPNDRLEFARAIKRLADDPELRAEMGKVGMTRVREHMNWGIEAPKYIAVYSRLFESGPGANSKNPAPGAAAHR